ncbi:MAG: PASTA domain-containing protein [Rikenellaceae bacterium]|nr:PASTA domain-containing protein [Rikenellaceae bacterium]
MDFLRKIYAFVAGHRLVRHLILALCAVLVFVFITNILLNLFTRHNTSEAVPDFSGMQVSQAEAASKGARLIIDVTDSLYVPAYDGGVILDQLPKPGTRVKKGRRVLVTINSHKQRMVDVPYVTGYSLRQAKNNILVAGLEIEKLIFREDIAANNVLEERFGGTVITRNGQVQAEQGSGITLVVGTNEDSPSPVVPKLIGFPLNEAKSRLWEAGLNAGKVEYDADITLLTRSSAKVYEQGLGQGARARSGTEVSLRLTLDAQKIEQGSKSSDTAARRRASAEE